MLLVFVAFGATMCVSNRAKADLDTRNMFSIEWLVDESDTIAIVRDLPNPEEDDETARLAIKKAAECTEATEVFHFDKSSREVVAWTAADVRAAAKAELRKSP